MSEPTREELIAKMKEAAENTVWQPPVPRGKHTLLKFENLVSQVLRPSVEGGRMKMSDKAVLYTRFSPRPNADDSDSCEKQDEICREYCEKKGYEVVGYFEDKKLSGDEADRPGLWEALGALKRGYVLVVRWRNRLARDVYLSEVIRRRVKKAGARIEAVEGDTNGDSPQDVLVRQIFAAMSEYEKKLIGIRTKYAMLKHQANGRIMGGVLPYGYKKDPDRTGYMIPCPAEQEVIGEIRQLAVDGYGVRQIAATLDIMGYIPRRGKIWNHRLISNILKRQMEV